MMLSLRKDRFGAMSVGGFLETILLIIVMVVAVGALFATLNSSLTSYATNETTFGPILLVLVPILIGAAILIHVVRETLSKA